MTLPFYSRVTSVLTRGCVRESQVGARTYILSPYPPPHNNAPSLPEVGVGECSRSEQRTRTSLGMLTGNTHRAREEGDAAGDKAGRVRRPAGWGWSGLASLRVGCEPTAGSRAERCTACLETGSHCAQTKPSTGKDRRQWRLPLVRQREGPMAGVSGRRKGLTTPWTLGPERREDYDGSRSGARASKRIGLPVTLTEEYRVMGKVSGSEDFHKSRLGT